MNIKIKTNEERKSMITALSHDGRGIGHLNQKKIFNVIFYVTNVETVRVWFAASFDKRLKNIVNKDSLAVEF